LEHKVSEIWASYDRDVDLLIQKMMLESYSVLIDFNEANIALDRASLEILLLKIADEMQSGNLVQDASLVRDVDTPDSAKSGAAAFLVGILTAEINRENLGKVMDYLGNLRYGKTIVLSGEIDGMTYNIEYRNKQELDQAVETIERLSKLRIKIQGQQRN
jgi:hypothetical protein